MTETIFDFLDKDIERQVDPRLPTLAEAVARQQRGALAILAYGSVLRGEPLEGTLADFYMIVENRKCLSASWAARLGGAFLPPNVYYFEVAGLRCKYAVVALDDFRAWCSADTSNPYFWARFSQPVALVYVRESTSKAIIVSILAEALATANACAITLHNDNVERWRLLFEQTYRTELRPESRERATRVVTANEEFYRHVTALLPLTTPIHANWRRIRLQGRLLSMLRLAKAAFTFQGGADYAAWKIQRHTGERIEIKDWHRRHPLLAGLVLLPRLLRRGALK